MSTAPQTPAQNHVILAAPAGSRLEQLADAYALLKPQFDEAKARLEEITDALKQEMAAAAPGADKVDLNTPGLPVPLRLQSRIAWRVDVTRLKAEAPETYVRYAKQAAYWELRSVKPRGSR